MAERQRAFVNRIADGLVLHLRQHVQTYPERWFTRPATIERGIGANSDKLPRPSIFVVAVNNEPAEEVVHAFGAESYRRKKLLTIAGFCDGGADREELVEELVADIRRAIVSNLQLSGVEGDTPVLESGKLTIRSDRTDVEISVSGAGKSSYEISVEASFQWDEDTA